MPEPRGNPVTDSEGNSDDPDSKHLRTKKIVWIFTSFALIIFCIMVGVYLGWSYRVRDFDTSTSAPEEPNYMGRTVSLEADLISVDPVAGTIIIDWYIVDDSTCQSPGSSPSQDCQPIGIFFESNPLQLIAGANSSNNAPSDPIFQYYPNVSLDARGSIAAWRTPISMIDRHSGTLGTGGISISTSLQSYPYDVYSANISLFAQEPDNLTAPVRLSVSHSQGIAVGFKVSAISDIINSTNGETLQISLQVSRGVLVKTYAIIIVVSVWVITLVFVCSTAAAIIFGIPQKAELLVVPVATLFAVTQLRGSMPGAPVGFGAIVDYVGLLPCLAIMSACAAFSIGILVFSDPTRHRRTAFDKLLAKPLSARGEYADLPMADNRV